MEGDDKRTGRSVCWPPTKTQESPAYLIDNTTFPPICLPMHLDRSDLHDITKIGDPWRVYLDPTTGKTHDGAVYAEKAMRT